MLNGKLLHTVTIVAFNYKSPLGNTDGEVFLGWNRELLIARVHKQKVQRKRGVAHASSNSSYQQRN